MLYSTWGQFFRNAELEKTLDQDLSRLYPEHWCYFQAPGCQGMVRRILLLWCLKHPEYGYRQGMHELFAPLLYVLHVDIMRLSQVRKDYEDYFTDRFDSLSFEEKDISYTFDFNKFVDSMDDDEIRSQGYSKNIKTLDECLYRNRCNARVTSNGCKCHHLQAIELETTLDEFDFET
ncbi:hypothetical protein HID58_074075 [Brassica napus]|uniref:Rab-GAP TBC domain-containing protein n=1 Tax=Brassica napus TaxID=3708 RepID=A0ABQ7YFX7_BRANA|nr:hypothetical protein HID58_074075 [Brassica napus]